MKSVIYKHIKTVLSERKMFSVLIDPEEYNDRMLQKIVDQAKEGNVDFFLVGGSYITQNQDFEKTIQFLKSHSEIPVLIFPGHYTQVSSKADGILLLNLISGRNPEYLIGNHVLAARNIKKSHIEVIPTGYILIENGRTTSVEYVSNTKPIPADKHDIIVSTSIAGELMGNKSIYLEAGSGAINPIHSEIIRKVKENISIPLIVGGGITSKEMVNLMYRSGADMVVVGNILEKQPELIAILS